MSDDEKETWKTNEETCHRAVIYKAQCCFMYVYMQWKLCLNNDFTRKM